MEISILSYVKPVKQYFRKNKGVKLSQSKLCEVFKLTPSQIRRVIAEVRYEIPIANFGQKEYEFPKNKETILAYIDKLNRQLKEKAIKKNIAKRFI